MTGRTRWVFTKATLEEADRRGLRLNGNSLTPIHGAVMLYQADERNRHFAHDKVVLTASLRRTDGPSGRFIKWFILSLTSTVLNSPEAWHRGLLTAIQRRRTAVHEA